jgi:ubiquinone/menaquinone biosynthesis C-methylase UbiE
MILTDKSFLFLFFKKEILVCCLCLMSLAEMSANFASRRFQSAAAHYVAGRPPYSPALIAQVASRLALTPSDRLLDLGCGPANLALAFAPYAGEILAVDPEPAMLALAQDATRNVANVHVQAGSSADLSARFGRFRAAIIGRAFHWMDREDTLRRLDSMLDRNGAVCLFDDEHPKIPQNAWRREYQEIVARYSDDDEGRRWRKSDAYEPHISVLLTSPFCQIETLGVIVSQAVTADVLIERTLSQSSTSEARLGARTAAMVADLRGVVSGWGGVARVEIIEWTATIARKEAVLF